MDAGFLGAAVALCNLFERHRRSGARPRWIVGRAVYFPGYSRAVEKRLPGFFIQSTASTACLLLFIGAGAGVVMHLLGS